MSLARSGRALALRGSRLCTPLVGLAQEYRNPWTLEGAALESRRCSSSLTRVPEERTAAGIASVTKNLLLDTLAMVRAHGRRPGAGRRFARLHAGPRAWECGLKGAPAPLVRARNVRHHDPACIAKRLGHCACSIQARLAGPGWLVRPVCRGVAPLRLAPLSMGSHPYSPTIATTRCGGLRRLACRRPRPSR